MQYGEIVSSALAIAWRRRYLWLIALLGGEGGAGGCFPGSGYSSDGGGLPSSFRRGGGPPPIPDWLPAVIAVSLVIAVIIGLAFFIASCVAAPATVRAAAEHDAGRPFGLGAAWSAGRHRFGAVLRLRLLQVAAVLGPALFVGLFLTLGIVAIALHQPVAGALILVLAGILGLLLVAYIVVLSALLPLALRAVTLELVGATEGVRRALALARLRTGRLAVTWLLGVGLGIAAGIAIGIPLIILAVPLVALAAGAYALGQTAVLVAVVVVAGLLVLALALVAGGAVSAFMSCYWTLAYRRLDVDPAPGPPVPAG